MSDIAVRLDGLLLAAVLALTGVVFAIVALVALALRRRRLAAGAAGLAGISLAALAAVLLVIDAPTVTSQPYDWIDWFIVPWLALAGLGTARLVRAAGPDSGRT